MSRAVAPATRIGRMKRAIEKKDIQGFLSEMIVLGLESNETSDFKMSPRNLFEMADLLVKLQKMDASGKLKEGTSWFDVINSSDPQ